MSNKQIVWRPFLSWLFHENIYLQVVLQSQNMLRKVLCLKIFVANLHLFSETIISVYLRTCNVFITLIGKLEDYCSMSQDAMLKITFYCFLKNLELLSRWPSEFPTTLAFNTNLTDFNLIFGTVLSENFKYTSLRIS